MSPIANSRPSVFDFALAVMMRLTSVGAWLRAAVVKQIDQRLAVFNYTTRGAVRIQLAGAHFTEHSRRAPVGDGASSALLEFGGQHLDELAGASLGLARRIDVFAQVFAMLRDCVDDRVDAFVHRGLRQQHRRTPSVARAQMHAELEL